jgi:hypothetical protein
MVGKINTSKIHKYPKYKDNICEWLGKGLIDFCVTEININYVFMDILSTENIYNLLQAYKTFYSKKTG